MQVIPPNGKSSLEHDGGVEAGKQLFLCNWLGRALGSAAYEEGLLVAAPSCPFGLGYELLEGVQLFSFFASCRTQHVMEFAFPEHQPSFPGNEDDSTRSPSIPGSPTATHPVSTRVGLS